MEPAEFWNTGNYAVVGDLWAQAGRDLVESLAVEGRDVVDLATGTGVTAIAAAEHGARSVTGVDVTASLLAEAERRGREAGRQITWIEADMHTVPLPDGVADLVLSTFGLVFSPEPRRAVTEARRLLRPSGELVFTSWASSGLFGRVRQVLADYFPEAPEPWHERREDIRELLGPGARVEERWFSLPVGSAESFVAMMEEHSAPIIIGAQSLGARWPQAREALRATVQKSGSQQGGQLRLPVSYLVTTLGAQ